MTSRFPTEHERTKRDVLGKLLDAGLVAIQLDSRADGVDVPPQHLGQSALVLNLSRNFNQRVLELGPLSISATLSFNGSPHTCVIPYDAIYSMVSQSEGKHFLFAESLPVEMREQLADAQVEAEESDAQDDSGPEDEPPPGPPVLRLVK